MVCFYLGVDDGHFQKVLDNELRALQNACKGKMFKQNLRDNFIIFGYFSSLHE